MQKYHRREVTILRKTILSVLFAVLLFLPLLAFGEGVPEIDDVRTAIGENYVAYPQLKGMADEEVQQKINDDIVLSSGVANHLVTLATLGESSWGLQADYETAMLNESVFSVIFSAKGKMPDAREGQAYAALSYDLSTGQRLTLDMLFEDVEAAVAWMEEDAVESFDKLSSGYMEFDEVTPLPRDSFTLDEDGITFWYPSDQLFLLSGYAGACRFTYEELSEWLLADEEALPQRLGLIGETLTDEAIKKAIEESAASGELPHIPVRLGEAMEEIVEAYRLAQTPDQFPGGRYFVMEAPAFRDVMLISDAIQSGYEASVLEGIQLRRGSMYGLMIGQTQRERWLSLLGEPDEVMTFSQSMAYDYGLPAGQSDIYHFGEYELRLHSDETQTLRAIQLCK